MKIWKLEITADRWPWQGYGWGLSTKLRAPLNSSGARFGGGWKYKLGIDIGGTTILINLVFGMIRIKVNKNG